MRESNDRVERLLVGILLESMKGSNLEYKVLRLNRLGFSNLEVADLLDTSPQVVANYIYKTRKGRPPRSKRTKVQKGHAKS